MSPPRELEPAVHREILRISKAAEKLVDQRRHEEAILRFREGLELVPEGRPRPGS